MCCLEIAFVQSFCEVRCVVIYEALEGMVTIDRHSQDLLVLS